MRKALKGNNRSGGGVREIRMKKEGEEMSSWTERITAWSLMLMYGFVFFMVMKGVFYIFGLIQHGICFLFGWPTKY
jgi:hypothetical protein